MVPGKASDGCVAVLLCCAGGAGADAGTGAGFMTPMSVEYSSAVKVRLTSGQIATPVGGDFSVILLKLGSIIFLRLYTHRNHSGATTNNVRTNLGLLKRHQQRPNSDRAGHPSFCNFSGRRRLGRRRKRAVFGARPVVHHGIHLKRRECARYYQGVSPSPMECIREARERHCGAAREGTLSN